MPLRGSWGSGLDVNAFKHPRFPISRLVLTIPLAIPARAWLSQISMVRTTAVRTPRTMTEQLERLGFTLD